MLLKCNNAGCFNLSDVKLDQESNEIICLACGKSLKNMTETTKKMLRDAKEFLKKDKPRGAFSVNCKNCKRTVTPLRQKKGNKYFCPECEKELELSEAFKNAISNFKK